MYIDAFRTEVEVPLSRLREQLSAMAAGHLHIDIYLSAASKVEITLRTSRNMMHSIRILNNRPLNNGTHLDTHGWPDATLSLYAALFSSVILSQDISRLTQEDRRRMQHHLPFLLEHFQ